MIVGDRDEEMAGPMAEAQAWIEACTGTPFDKEFAEYLKDGTALCELANAVEPGAIPKINRSALAFKQMENVSLFTRWARSSLGLKEADLFDTVDLYQAHDIARVVSAIRNVGGAVQKKGAFDGPTLGKARLDRNVREFTEEQLNAAKGASTFLGKGSHGTAGAAVSKLQSPSGPFRAR